MVYLSESASWLMWGIVGVLMLVVWAPVVAWLVRSLVEAIGGSDGDGDDEAGL